MRPSKTERARDALQNHSAGLSLVERRVLILCDGLRNETELIAMLGATAVPALERLVREGYLAVAGAPKETRQSPPAAEAMLAVMRDATPVAAAPAASTARRSLAASRMYLLDMLQLQRDPHSAALHARIQRSLGEEGVAESLLDAFRHLQAVASSGYAKRVGERLAEILPEAYLSGLQAIRDGGAECA